MRSVWIAAILFVAALGVVGWRYETGGFPFAPPMIVPAPEPPHHVLTDADITKARRTIADHLNQAPEFASFFDSLRTSFPGDYQRVPNTLVERAATGDKNDTVDSDLSEAYRVLRQTRGILAAKASPDALDRVLATQTAVFKALGETDSHLCVDVLYGGAGESYFAFSATHRALVGAMADASIDAIIDGGNARTERQKPTDGDFQAFEQALKARGLTADEIGALVDGKLPNPPIKDDRMCVAGQIRLQALKSLNSDQRQRIYALMLEMMARS